MPNLSRRKWLKTAALTTTLFAGASSASAKAFDPLPEKWDETFDVVVIGSGFAGLAAAIEARLAGASVCVLEKMRVIGGNSIINGGIMGVPGTPMQKKEGLEDSPELMAKDMMTEGGGLNQPEKVRHLCEEALPTKRSALNGSRSVWRRKAVIPCRAARLLKTAPVPALSSRKLPSLKRLESNRAPALIWSASFGMPTAE